MIVFVLFIFGTANFLLSNIFPEDIIEHTAEEYVQINGYPFENHYVTTNDGYILNLHRISNGKGHESNNKVALLEHGMLGSSESWVVIEKSLAFILADEGYDVWLGNGRGNKYSRNHTILNPDTDSQFWNFSWHEIGISDLSASIDYILENTNKDGLYYIGVSQGCTILYVLLSTVPKYNEKIIRYVNMAPVVFMNHMLSPTFQIPAIILKITENFLPLTGGIEMLSSNGLIHQIFTKICSQRYGMILCEEFISLTFGYSPSELNHTLTPISAIQITQGISSKQFIHFLQEVSSGHFRQYDYGTNGNLLQYERSTPPDYDLGKVTAPGLIIYSSNDWTVDHLIDIPRLSKALGSSLRTFLVPIPTFNHLNFVTGLSAPEIVYTRIIQLFDET